jgi:hypothetical protein
MGDGMRDEDSNPMRGVLYGVAFGLVLWGVMGLVWWVVRS